MYEQSLQWLHGVDNGYWDKVNLIWWTIIIVISYVIKLTKLYPTNLPPAKCFTHKANVSFPDWIIRFSHWSLEKNIHYIDRHISVLYNTIRMFKILWQGWKLSISQTLPNSQRYRIARPPPHASAYCEWFDEYVSNKQEVLCTNWILSSKFHVIRVDTGLPHVAIL